MTDAIATVTDHASLVEAFRTIKERLGLSNAFCDDIGGLTSGYTDKVLGPARTKNIGQVTFDVFCTLFAVKFVMVHDVEAANRMASRWEQRETSHVRLTPSRVSAKVIESAKPHIFSEMGKRSAIKRMTCSTVEQRSKIARKAARARWRKHRKAERERRGQP